MMLQCHRALQRPFVFALGRWVVLSNRTENTVCPEMLAISSKESAKVLVDNFS